ncbi:MAG: type IV toxin-antitoxin system AbiEi family antitoxin domain-containing protein [Gaiellaceae bacterium]
MPQYATLGPLSRLAEEQWGLVTRRQAAKVGVPQTTFERLIADGSILERVANGVYRYTGAPLPDHLDLRAAWLQLAPEVPAWERTPDQGLVSHRSAASLYGLGHLPADVHDFTLATRKQTRRPDVRLHRRGLSKTKWTILHGLPVTRPSVIAADLLADREDPQAVAQIVADAIRGVYDYPGTFAERLAPYAGRFHFRRDDGLALLRWLLSLAADPDASRWLQDAEASTRGSEPAS